MSEGHKDRVMDFPDYIPNVVCKQIAALIEGDATDAHGLAESLASTEQRLIDIEQALEVATGGDPEYVAALQCDKVETSKARKMLADDIDCLRRLVHDSRMQQVYALLIGELTEAEQWRKFIRFAWAARTDYAVYRDRLERAAESLKKIASGAQELVKSMNDLASTGVHGPSEFYYIAELLRRTDNTEIGGHNRHIWRSMRKQLLGETAKNEVKDNVQYELPLPPSPSDHIVEIDGVTVHLPRIHFVSPGESVTPDPNGWVRYGWEKAPPPVALLSTLAEVARSFIPTEVGFVKAAIASRKRHSKMEYLRGFASLLLEEHKFKPTVGVMKAVATTSNVVYADPDFDVSYDDVRKVFRELCP
jgi:hypothetical protein